MKIVVDVADMKYSKNPGDVLITHSLGSCVGLALYDPGICVGALLHAMLPLSKIDREKAEARPYMFTDVAVAGTLEKMYDLGAGKSRIIAKVAGASSLLDEKKLLKIGERNYTVLRKILWKNDILIAAEDIGGRIPRTMSLYMESGVTTVRTSGTEREL